MADSHAFERVVAGRYRLVEPLGRGGMGIVWRAVDETLDREVAIKELRGSAELTGPEREMFTTRTFREARAAGRLSHPSVAAVYDVFQENGHPWIVMQLVPSRTLGSILRGGEPLPPRQVAEIGRQVLEALRAAHAAGVLHRDVKPDNVLITSDGHAVLTDFGIASMEDDSPMTRTGTLIGTPAFIAPERAAGGQAQPASDLWSLGVMLFQAVEGRSPFRRGHVLATLAAVMYQEPGPLHLAGPLAPVIEGLLVKDPATRMTASEAARLLEAVASGQVTMPVRARLSKSPSLVTRYRRRGLFTSAFIFTAGLAAGATGYVISHMPGTVTAAPFESTPTVTVVQTQMVRTESIVKLTAHPTARPRTHPATAPARNPVPKALPPPVPSGAGKGPSSQGNGPNGRHEGAGKQKEKKGKESKGNQKGKKG
jgi:serine/threonine protein kinase